MRCAELRGVKHFALLELTRSAMPVKPALDRLQFVSIHCFVFDSQLAVAVIAVKDRDSGRFGRVNVGGAR